MVVMSVPHFESGARMCRRPAHGQDGAGRYRNTQPADALSGATRVIALLTCNSLLNLKSSESVQHAGLVSVFTGGTHMHTYIALHCIALHGMAWHGMASHRIASHRITSHHITYTHIYIYIYMYVCMYACMHGWMDVCMYVCLYVCLCVCMYVMYVCMYVCMHACMHACM